MFIDKRDKDFVLSLCVCMCVRVRVRACVYLFNMDH